MTPARIAAAAGAMAWVRKASRWRCWGGASSWMYTACTDSSMPMPTAKIRFQVSSQPKLLVCAIGQMNRPSISAAAISVHLRPIRSDTYPPTYSPIRMPTPMLAPRIRSNWNEVSRPLGPQMNG